MNKILLCSMVALLGLTAPAMAQEVDEKVEKGVKKAWKKTKKAGKKAGNKTAELAVKGEARLTDPVSDVYVGRRGQTIYLEDGTYYWVNKRGRKKYVEVTDLERKPKDD